MPISRPVYPSYNMIMFRCCTANLAIFRHVLTGCSLRSDSVDDECRYELSVHTQGELSTVNGCTVIPVILTNEIPTTTYSPKHLSDKYGWRFLQAILVRQVMTQIYVKYMFQSLALACIKKIQTNTTESSFVVCDTLNSVTETLLWLLETHKLWVFLKI